MCFKRFVNVRQIFKEALAVFFIGTLVKRRRLDETKQEKRRHFCLGERCQGRRKKRAGGRESECEGDEDEEYAGVCCHVWRRLFSQSCRSRRRGSAPCVFSETPGLSAEPRWGDGNVKSKNNLMERVKGEVNKQKRSTVRT